MRYAAVSGAILLAAAGLIATYVRVPPPHIGSGSVCRTAARPLARLELLFGSTRKDLTPIGEEEWAAFVAAEITPRFPDGLTILTGYGQWRDATGTIVKETSRLLLIWYAPAVDSDSRIEAIRTAYKARFGQESVLRADGAPACVSF